MKFWALTDMRDMDAASIALFHFVMVSAQAYLAEYSTGPSGDPQMPPVEAFQTEPFQLLDLSTQLNDYTTLATPVDTILAR